MCALTAGKKKTTRRNKDAAAHSFGGWNGAKNPLCVNRRWTDGSAEDGDRGTPPMVEPGERFAVSPISPYIIYHNGKAESIDRMDSVKP